MLISVYLLFFICHFSHLLTKFMKRIGNIIQNIKCCCAVCGYAVQTT